MVNIPPPTPHTIGVLPYNEFEKLFDVKVFVKKTLELLYYLTNPLISPRQKQMYYNFMPKLLKEALENCKAILHSRMVAEELE